MRLDDTSWLAGGEQHKKTKSRIIWQPHSLATHVASEPRDMYSYYALAGWLAGWLAGLGHHPQFHTPPSHPTFLLTACNTDTHPPQATGDQLMPLP